MKDKIKLKKSILSAIAVLTISATATCGALSFAACGDKSIEKTSSEGINTTVLSTAEGQIKNIDSGKTYYVSNTPSQQPDGSKEKPYGIVALLGAESGNSLLKPGDTVLIVPGHYSISQTIGVHVSGAYNSYIKFVNAAYVDGSGYETSSSKEVILDFSNQSFLSTARGVQIYGNYTYWFGIDICGAGDNGMYIGGSYNTVEFCEFYNNRDTGLQLGRSYSDTTDYKYNEINWWPSYNLIKNCTSHNNYDNETYGENADGFAAKLTVGYGNVFDGCIAYRNSDDGWDLYAKTESGNIGAVIMYNCVAFENGYLEYTQQECNSRFSSFNKLKAEVEDPKAGITANEYGQKSYKTRDGDGNGFKLGGSTMEGDVILVNCLSYGNKLHGVTDNSNPGVISVKGVTSYNNGAVIDNDSASVNFGQIRDVSDPTNAGSANIDVARHAYSYNNFSHVLSVQDDLVLSISNDKYKGSATDCYFNGGSYANVISGSIDASTNGGTNMAFTEQKNALISSEIFKELPVVKSGTNYTYNLSGLGDLGNYDVDNSLTLNSNRVHLKYRNAADKSLNMGSMLAVKDYSGLFGDNNKIGSVLDKTSWEQYQHFYTSDYVKPDADSEEASKVARAKEALTISCDIDAVYQDFDVPSKMIDCNIEWVSEKVEYLEIGTEKDIALSKAEYYRVYVNRPLGQDEKVKLTANITCGGVTDSVEFVLTVKAGKPSIGTMFVTSGDGQKILNNGSYVVDRYSVVSEPVLSVENALDYNGKLLKKDQYKLESTYMYAPDAKSTGTKIKGYTPGHEGVYTITHKVTLLSDQSTKTMTYKIYTSSPFDEVDFNGNTSLTVNQKGYSISGKLTNATGYLYAVSSPDQLTDITRDNIKTYNGVNAYPFRGDKLEIQFPNDNINGYNVYFALANRNGDIKSEIYTKSVGTVDITTTEEFIKMASGELINAESPSSTIYRLTNDLDFSGVNYKLGKKPFVGLFNGMGHTISGITLTGSGQEDCVGVFYKVSGGTIENVKFNNIKVDGGIGDKNNKVGIVGECTGGNFYNIALTDINIKAGQRAGGLIGAVGAGTQVYIEQVSLINSANYSINATQRAGGLVGFSQASSGLGRGSIDICFRNCYVDTVVNANFELGGIFGTYDCGNNANCTYNLEITSCMFVGTVHALDNAKTYAGGILGYQKGALSNMEISNTISFATLMFNGSKLLSTLKNCSQILGCSPSNFEEGIVVNVRSCIATMEEYNTSCDVTVLENLNNIFERTFISRLSKDNWNYIYNPNPEDPDFPELASPYVQLKFLGNWS